MRRCSTTTAGPSPAAGTACCAASCPSCSALTETQVNGRTVHISYSAVAVRDRGQRFAGWRGSARDVSVRRQSELWARQQHLLLQRITAQVPGVIFRARRRDDGLPEFLYLSPAAPALFGFSAEAACADSRLVVDRVHHDDRAGILEQFAAASRSVSPLHCEYRMVLPGKDVRWVETRALPEIGSQGLVWNGYTADITARKQSERALHEAQSASRVKSEFLSRASHELRTPLNSILGFTQLLALDTEHPLQPQQRRQMHNVQHAGRHLLGLIDDLLQISSLENRQAVLELGSIDLSATLSVCLELLAPQARRSGVVLLEAPPAPAFVRANRRALEQVLMNLLSNAVKYNRRGGCVEIVLGGDGARVTLAISDQGPGLTPEQQQRLFQPFERLGGQRGSVQGSGLGLVITRDLVQAMGGTLAVHSAPGQGSTFTLSLEAGDAQAASVPGAFVDSITDTLLDATPSPRRVLYVEDDPLNVLLMEEVIRRTPSWTMSVADSGVEGLRAARVMQPDLVLLDINLPDLDGTAIVAALRADPATAHLRCIALSADAMSAQIDAAMAAGFDDYWLKPLDVAALIEQFGRLARAPASSWAPPAQS